MDDNINQMKRRVTYHEDINIFPDDWYTGKGFMITPGGVKCYHFLIIKVTRKQGDMWWVRCLDDSGRIYTNVVSHVWFDNKEFF